MELLDRGWRGFFDRVGDGENAGGVSVDRDEDRALALLLQQRGFRFEILKTANALRAQEIGLANKDAAAVDVPDHSAPGGGFEIGNQRHFYITLFCTIHDCRSERVLAVLFDCRGRGEQLLFSNGPGRNQCR